MSKQKLQAVAIQKSLELSEQEAVKVLVFIAGMEAGREIQSAEKTDQENSVKENQRNPTKQLV